MTYQFINVLFIFVLCNLQWLSELYNIKKKYCPQIYLYNLFKLGVRVQPSYWLHRIDTKAPYHCLILEVVQWAINTNCCYLPHNFVPSSEKYGHRTWWSLLSSLGSRMISLRRWGGWILDFRPKIEIKEVKICQNEAMEDLIMNKYTFQNEIMKKISLNVQIDTF